jgi:ABC-type lipoprotein release transport system permease subunit
VGADFRRRWVAWLGLALAIGLAGAVVLTAAAGARRTATAFDRFLDQGNAEDLSFSIGRPTDPEMQQAIKEIEALPQVEAASSVAALVVYDRNLEAPYQFAGIDGRYGNTIDRPNVLEGRRPDPDRADELLVNRTFARQAHVGAGDTIDMYAFEPREIEVANPKVSDATKVRMKIVGVGVYPNEVVATAEYDSLPFAYFTPAFLREHPKETQEYGFEVVRLKNGRADLAEFRKGLASVVRAHGGDPDDMFFTDRAEAYSQVRRAIQPQAIALAVFAVLVALAFVMIVVQVLARQIFLDARDYRALATLGMTRRQRFATAMARVVVVSIGGAVIALVGAALASPLMPIGPARLAEPNRGIALNLAVLLGGLVLIPLVISALVAIPAWRASAGHAGSPVRVRRRRVGDALAAGGAPPSVVIGVRSGLSSGSGRGRVPVRSAVIVSGLAVALVAGTVGFTTNLDRLANSPRLYGWNWSFIAGNGFFPVHPKETMAGLQEVPDVDAVGAATYDSIEIDSRPVATVGIDGLRGEVFPTLLEGRAPRATNEVVLGTRTLRRADREVGDTVRTTISGRARTLRVVGRAVFPNLGAGSFSPTNLGEGAAMTVDGLDVGPNEGGGRYSVVLIRMRPGADLVAAQRRIGTVLRPMELCGGDRDCVQRASRPGDVRNYTRVRGTGVVLSAALAVIALGFLVHVLVSSVRRRRGDLAVFKTLGFARRQVAATSVWQAATMAALALLIGIPVGLAVSTLVWRGFAEALGIAPDGVIPGVAFLAIPVVLALAAVVALVPAFLAARTHPATVLRSE